MGGGGRRYGIPGTGRCRRRYARRETEELTAAQKAAVEDIGASIDSGRFSAYLLYGVTGSGKTEVYIRAVQRALEMGKGLSSLSRRLPLLRS